MTVYINLFLEDIQQQIVNITNMFWIYEIQAACCYMSTCPIARGK